MSDMPTTTDPGTPNFQEIHEDDKGELQNHASITVEGTEDSLPQENATQDTDLSSPSAERSLTEDSNMFADQGVDTESTPVFDDLASVPMTAEINQQQMSQADQLSHFVRAMEAGEIVTDQFKDLLKDSMIVLKNSSVSKTSVKGLSRRLSGTKIVQKTRVIWLDANGEVFWCTKKKGVTSASSSKKYPMVNLKSVSCAEGVVTMRYEKTKLELLFNTDEMAEDFKTLMEAFLKTFQKKLKNLSEVQISDPPDRLDVMYILSASSDTHSPKLSIIRRLRFPQQWSCRVLTHSHLSVHI